MSDWQPISTAPKDRIIWVYAPGVQELGPITCLCQWHEDGGFCVDELRWPTLWHTPKPPEPPLIERKMTGILAALTDEQREHAFAYDGPINHGDPVFERPAVPIEKSVTEDYVICLEDGKKFKSLKRHLMMHYNLTPDEYREKWGLPADYPMVAPSYAEARKRLAASMGLGRSPRRKAS